MAHKKVLKCRVARHRSKPRPGKAARPMAQGHAKGKPKLKSRVKRHRAHKPRNAKAKAHLAQQKAAGASPSKCQAPAADPGPKPVAR
jgi:predicted secreted protein